MTERLGTIGLAGWLFADVLLAMSILFLGTATTGDPPVTTTTTTTTTTTSATTTTTIPAIQGLNPEPTLITVDAINLAALADPGSEAAVAEATRIEEEVRRQLPDLGATTKVGISLTFGVHPTVGRGQVIASAFNDVLKNRFPDQFGEAALRTFDFRTSENQGSVRVELYFLLRG